MLDLLFNPLKAERHPIEILIIGIFYSSLSIFLGLWVFQVSTSLAIVFLTVLSCLYVVQGAIKMEEKKEKNYQSERWILKEHKKLVILILALFMGFLISFSIWSMILPHETSSKVFDLQRVSVERIRAITASAIETSNPLSMIFFNNLNIIGISLIFALFYGAGAIYILVWNASVMGYVIGTTITANGILSAPLALTKYFLHGIPEMIAYILAAITGGILYFAFIKGDLTNKYRIKRIVIDLLTLIAISITLLIVSALIEVYISSRI